MVLQQPVLAAKVAVAEATVPRDALRLVLAFLDGAPDLLGRHVSGTVEGGGGLSAVRLFLGSEVARGLSRSSADDAAGRRRREQRLARQVGDSQSAAAEEGQSRFRLAASTSKEAEGSQSGWRCDEMLGMGCVFRAESDTIAPAPKSKG